MFTLFYSVQCSYFTFFLKGLIHNFDTCLFSLSSSSIKIQNVSCPSLPYFWTLSSPSSSPFCQPRVNWELKQRNKKKGQKKEEKKESLMIDVSVVQFVCKQPQMGVMTLNNSSNPSESSQGLEEVKSTRRDLSIMLVQGALGECKAGLYR